jgi:hypothetical protein
MLKERIAIMFDPEVVKLIETHRGKIPKSTYVNNLVWTFLNASDKRDCGAIRSVSVEN